MKSNDQRILRLSAVVNLQSDYINAMKELENEAWDFDGNPLIMTQSIFKKILSDYIQGKITAAIVREWAEFLELREDIDFSEHDELALSGILYELANPDLEGELTPARAKVLVSQL